MPYQRKTPKPVAPEPEPLAPIGDGPPEIVREALFTTLLGLIGQARREECEGISAKIEELFGYLGIDPSGGSSRDEIIDNLYERRGLSPAEARPVADALTRRKVGRPPEAREGAVRAMEIRLHHPEYPWWQIADALCRCGLPTHRGPEGDRCMERIRQSVMALQKLLRNYGIDPEASLPGKS